MNFRNRIYKPLLIGLALVLLCGVSQTQRLLNQDRQRLGFTKLTPLENAPPVLAFTSVALGGFRGLIANILWIRAGELQDQDKFFEMVQLSEWITTLEPHFAQVWAHQAWNMAYNISVKFKEPADRWRWVERGVRLLRDQGLKYNPDDALMYRELSWLFQHKIGYNMDDAHTYYKTAWASEMQEIFGGKPNIQELIHPSTPEAQRRSELLRKKYNMDPQIMAEVDQAYGPLEWRLPDAHAIYWAELGRRKGKAKDQETLRRSIYQSMQQAFFGGGMSEVKYGTNATFMIGPNLDLTEKVSASYESMMTEDPSMKEHIGKAHRNFLKVAIYMLYADGRTKEAEKWFAYTKKLYPDRLTANSLDAYALEQLGLQLAETDHNKTTAAIESLLRNAYTNLAMDKDDAAANYERMAKYVWNYFDSKVMEMSHDTKQRIGLQPLPEIKRVVLDQLLDSETGLRPEFAAMLRSKLNLPPPTNQPPAAVEGAR